MELKQVTNEQPPPRLIINRQRRQAQYFIEDLDNNINLEMVAIPPGTFLMGSPDTEDGHRDNESPQHEVTVKSFFMGKYPVTQEQWQVVASLPQVNRELKPNPSYFKGAKRPVEYVSWYDAVEFCSRLIQKTGREYRLPSEAEWEYACRAGTTNPFHFGETITTELANYNGNYTYGTGFKGEYRQETTPVGSFGVANKFGLYDMHGNVWEWCTDQLHPNYERAATDGSVWKNDRDNYSRMIRGGSWRSNPAICRSAFRGSFPLGYKDRNIGFRVVCGVAWTL